MFFIQYETRPTPDNDLFEEVGGAVVNCFVIAESAEAASELALQNFKDNGWEVVTVEDGPSFVERADYLSDIEWLQWFDQAAQDGECYVFHQWPVGPQEGDEVH